MTNTMKDDIVSGAFTTKAIDNHKIYEILDDLLERRDQGVDIERFLQATLRNTDDLAGLLAVAVEAIYQAQG